jgi:hypothetical protein
MHRYRIFAQISLILSIVNLVLAAPTRIVPLPGVPEAEVPEASGDPGPSEAPHALAAPVQIEPEVSQAEVPEASGDPGPSEAPLALAAPVQIGPEVPKAEKPEATGDPSPSESPDTMAHPEHEPPLDETLSSGYPTPHLSETSSISGNSWMLNRTPRLSPGRPPSPPYTSASDGSLTSHYFTASDGLPSSPGWVRHPGVSRPNTFWTKNKLRVMGDVAIIAIVFVGIWGLTTLKHHDDSQDRDTGS